MIEYVLINKGIKVQRILFITIMNYKKIPLKIIIQPNIIRSLSVPFFFSEKNVNIHQQIIASKIDVSIINVKIYIILYLNWFATMIKKK